MEESSTELLSAEKSEQALSSLVGRPWAQVAALLPGDLEASAQATGALRRRRGIRSAIVLLRIVLAYAVLDWSLRLLGAWCVLQDLADVSDVALLKRLRHSRTWLGYLLTQCLRQRQVHLTPCPGVRLRLRDATVVSRPGSQGTDWRVHLSLDLGRLCVDGVEVTDASGGESLARFPAAPGDIEVADRGYAFAGSLGPPLATGSQVVVRINWQNLPLWSASGQRLDIIAWLRCAMADPAQETLETGVWLATPQGQFQLRLIAGRLPAEAAERARRKAYSAARKKGRTPDQRTLLACDFVLLLTSLPSRWWAASNVLDLYRLRWQVELLFKRFKSLLNFDGLRSQDPELTQTYLLAKLVAALLIEALTASVSAQAPEWFLTPKRPISLWRLTALLWEQLRQCICGVFVADAVPTKLARLKRFLCEPPRRRQQQLARARLFLTRLSVVNVQPPMSLS
jgi:Transposase DDE domain